MTGWKNERGETVFTVKKALDPVRIARILDDILVEDGIETETLVARRAALAEGEELQPEDFLLPPLPSRRGPTKRPSKTRRRTRSSAPGNMR